MQFKEGKENGVKLNTPTVSALSFELKYSLFGPWFMKTFIFHFLEYFLIE